jgi:hypothetical protein
VSRSVFAWIRRVLGVIGAAALLLFVCMVVVTFVAVAYGSTAAWVVAVAIPVLLVVGERWPSRRIDEWRASSLERAITNARGQGRLTVRVVGEDTVRRYRLNVLHWSCTRRPAGDRAAWPELTVLVELDGEPTHERVPGEPVEDEYLAAAEDWLSAEGVEAHDDPRLGGPPCRSPGG